MKVSVQQSTMVRPSRDTPNRILWSSDLDLLVPMFHVQTVYFYKPNGSSMFFETQVLKDALSDVLVPFYPAAGRMGKNEDGRIEIHCNGEGILFVEAETSCFIDDLGDFTDSSKLLPLVPEVDYSGGISSYPLVVLQVSIALLLLRIICYCATSYSYFMAPKIEFRRIFLSFSTMH
ncbi:hypothetical protein OIU78_024052 [Salix suchowensis]|nr:hypothetical protein OIU78_024052 [Salix suchowensis]